MSENEQQAGRRKEWEGPQSPDKKAWNRRHWEDFQHYIMKTYLLFHSRPTSTDTLLPPHTILPMALSLTPFITLTQSVQHRALQMFSLPQAAQPHSHISAVKPYYHIWNNWIKQQSNQIYLFNQISTIKVNRLRSFTNFINLTPLKCSLMLLALFCATFL